MPVTGPSSSQPPTPFTLKTPSSFSTIFGTRRVIRVKRGDDGYWVAGSLTSRMAWASDPTGTWTQISITTSANILGLDYGNGYWVAIDDTATNGNLWYATDPTGTWTKKTMTGFSTGRNLKYLGGYWLAGYTGNGTAALAVATDPTGTWVNPTALESANTVVSMGYDGTYWAVGDFAGRVLYATDPTGTWSTVGTANLGATEVYAMHYANGYWTAASRSAANANVNFAYRAGNPTGTWTSNSTGLGMTSSSVNYPNWLNYLNGYWIIVGSGAAGVARYATDPTGTWTAATVGASNVLDMTEFYGGQYVVVGGNTGQLQTAQTSRTAARAPTQGVTRAAVF